MADMHTADTNCADRDCARMDGRRSWEPPIATLPRQDPVRAATAGPEPSPSAALAPGLGALAPGLGFARRAAQRERRLGWMLWGGLVTLVVVLSAT